MTVRISRRRLTRRQKEALNMRPCTSRYAMKQRAKRAAEFAASGF